MLTWNVYVGDFNTGKIELYNIFNHWAFYDDCVKAKKKFKDDKEGFAEEVRRDLEMYHDLKYPEDKLFSDHERKYEVHVFPEHNRYCDKKIDVYEQVMNNWDIFIDWLWDRRSELKARK